MALDILNLRQEDWRSEFGAGDLRRGLAYGAEKRSRLISLEGNQLVATCRGSGGESYRQRITLHAEGLRWGVVGHCSCPVGRNCKHVVCALIALEERQRSGAGLDNVIVPSIPVTEERLEGIAPRPVLSLGSHVRVHYDARRARMQEQTQHRAALAFDYAGHVVFGHPAQDLLIRAGATHNLRLIRDSGAEAVLRKQVEAYGAQRALRRSEALPEEAGEPYEFGGEAAWLAFVQNALPSLRDAGWDIHMQPDFHYNLAQVDDWYAQIEEPPGQTWFELELGIEVDGQRLDLLPILLQSIRRAPWLLDPDSVAQRGDAEVLLASLPQGGRRIALPFTRLRPILATLGELYLRAPTEPGARLRLERADAATLAALDEGPAFTWQGGEQLRDLARSLQQLNEQPPRLPHGLQAELRGYQAQGLAWMQALGELGFGGILGDDMGLGKTLQTLAHIQVEKDAGRLIDPVLIIAPVSLMGNWAREAERFCPGLRCQVLHGAGRHDAAGALADNDVVIAPYSLLHRDRERWLAQTWHLVVLDEAQNIKNASTHAAQVVSQLQTRHCLCLSGTPMENHLGEVWSLFHFLMPGFLGSQQRFKDVFRDPIEKQGDTARLAQLRARITPFMLRRTKALVASELPPKVESVMSVELSGAQADLYETIRLGTEKAVREALQSKGLAKSQITILDALLKLRQVCCDPQLVPLDAARKVKGSAKLEQLMTLLPEMLAEGRRILLFSQFTSMLTLIEAELKKQGLPWVKLTGQSQKRDAIIEQFTSGQVPLFLISLKAGGVGLNLPQADTVIHYDPWWNPAVEKQATDRAHRIGQTQSVWVVKLVAQGTIEERILALQERKAQLADSLYSGAAGRKEPLFSEDDVAQLLKPLS